MKKIIAAIALTAVAGSSQAALVTYQITGTHLSESQNNAPVDTYLFSDGTTINLNFAYDNSTPAYFSDQIVTGLEAFGHVSSYANNISNISGSVASYAFSADTGSTLVGNADAGGPGFLDGVFNVFGTINGAPVGIGFSGFETNGYTLIASRVFSIGLADYLDSQAMPNTLTNGPPVSQIDLIFADTNQNERITSFTITNLTPVSSVPIPAAAWLMGSSLLGLAGIARRRKA